MYQKSILNFFSILIVLSLFQAKLVYAQSLRLQLGALGGLSRFQADPPNFDLDWKVAFQADFCIEGWFSKQFGISLGGLTTQRTGQSAVFDSLSQSNIVQKVNLLCAGVPVEFLFYVPINRKTGFQFRGGIASQYLLSQKNLTNTWPVGSKFKNVFWFFLISAGLEHKFHDQFSFFAGLQYQQQTHDAVNGSFPGKFYLPGIIIQCSYFLQQ